jgi:hypothetical protein
LLTRRASIGATRRDKAVSPAQFFSAAEAELSLFFEKECVSRFRSASDLLPKCFRFASGFCFAEAMGVDHGDTKVTEMIGRLCAQAER